RRIVAAVMLPAAFAALDGEAGIAALAYGVIHRGHLCYESVVTDPGQRRRGRHERRSAPLFLPARAGRPLAEPVGRRIVAAEPADGAVAVGHGVAIDAAVRAGVVGTDIARAGAQAAGPVAALGRENRPAGDIRQPRRIDAARR